MKLVLTAQPESAYDDAIEHRYHFPGQYLRRMEHAIGDHVIYYEPRRLSASRPSGGRQSYFALAVIERVRPDPRLPDHFYADIRDYLGFERDVPFRSEGGRYFESKLLGPDGRANAGAFQHAVRTIPDEEFDAILAEGFPSAALLSDAGTQSGLGEQRTHFVRPLVETTITRPFRDRIFTTRVRSSYDYRCAVTGLRIINGGGRPEVQAAHIMPVAQNGPDSPRNGLALSGTVHWMFDRGLISIGENHEVLVADSSIPPELRGLLKPRLLAPRNTSDAPHPEFLRYHRENIFKG